LNFLSHFCPSDEEFNIGTLGIGVMEIIIIINIQNGTQFDG